MVAHATILDGLAKSNTRLNGNDAIVTIAVFAGWQRRRSLQWYHRVGGKTMHQIDYARQ